MASITITSSSGVIECNGNTASVYVGYPGDGDFDVASVVSPGAVECRGNSKGINMDIVGPNDQPCLRINDLPVVGPQQAAVADASGGSVVDVQARAALNALLARMRTHGMIGN